jgi:ATP-dependent Clp protease ATP-binding subunit ClpA
VDKFLLELEEQLALKNVSISVTRSAREWLAEKGFDPKMGARPMKRVIQEQIKRPLADDLLFGELVDGGEVRVSAPRTKGDKLQIKKIARGQELKALPAATD